MNKNIIYHIHKLVSFIGILARVKPLNIRAMVKVKL